MSRITVPERHVEAIDLMDEAIASLRTIHAAMSVENDDLLNHLAATQFDALVKLDLVRHHVNKQHAAI